MRNFIIFFDEKTGTSPLVQLLDEFGLISVVRIGKNTGFEPFDTLHCGRMKLDDLKQCLDLIYNQAPIDTEELNRFMSKQRKGLSPSLTERGLSGSKCGFGLPGPTLFTLITSLSGTNYWERYFESAICDLSEL